MITNHRKHVKAADDKPGGRTDRRTMMFFALETGQETFFPCILFSLFSNDQSAGLKFRNILVLIVHSPMIHIDRHHPQASIKSFYQEPSSVALDDIIVQLLIHSDSDCLLSFTHDVLF